MNHPYRAGHRAGAAFFFGLANAASVRGVFGVAKDHGDWLIFHLPTGMMFLYSAWPTLTEAKRFADALLEREAWNDPKLAEHPHRFNMICDEIADVLGEPRRTMRRIC